MHQFLRRREGLSQEFILLVYYFLTCPDTVIILAGSTAVALSCPECPAVLTLHGSFFYSASALLAMQSDVLATGILSVCPSVRLSVYPSRSGIVSRRMKIPSCGFQHLVGQSV